MAEDDLPGLDHPRGNDFHLGIPVGTAKPEHGVRALPAWLLVVDVQSSGIFRQKYCLRPRPETIWCDGRWMIDTDLREWAPHQSHLS